MAGRFKLEHPWKENIQKIIANNRSPDGFGREFCSFAKKCRFHRYDYGSCFYFLSVGTSRNLLASSSEVIFKQRTNCFCGYYIALLFAWAVAASSRKKNMASVPDRKKYRGTCVHRKVADSQHSLLLLFLDLSKTCEKRGQQGFLVSSHGDWYGWYHCHILHGSKAGTCQKQNVSNQEGVFLSCHFLYSQSHPSYESELKFLYGVAVRMPRTVLLGRKTTEK